MQLIKSNAEDEKNVRKQVFVTFAALVNQFYLFNMRKTPNSELVRQTESGFITAAKLPIVIVLDNVRSAHNVGSVFRTADAFLLAGVYLCGITATPPNKEIFKTALGASDWVSWQYAANTTDAVQHLKSEGYTIIAIEQADASVPLHRFMPDTTQQRYALVFGHEVEGVSEAVMALADECVEIPQLGVKHSLNIAVSVGVVLWEFVRGNMP